jgi:hypothetical protein
MYRNHKRGEGDCPEMEKLTDDELNQLKYAVDPYVACHAEGIFNRAVDALIAKFKTSAPMIDVTLATELVQRFQISNML